MEINGHTIAIRESGRDCQIDIDGVPVDVVRGADGGYHTSVFPFQDFPTAEAAARALAETEGTLWRIPPQGDPTHPHHDHH